MTPLLLVDGLAGAAVLCGLLLTRLEAIRRIRLFAALVTGLLVWFLVRSIPDSVSELTAQVLRVVAPHLSGPLELRQVELGLSIQGGEFVGAVLVLVAYAIGMRHARAPIAEQIACVVRLRAAAVLLAPLLWSAWAPHLLPRPPAGSGLALALSLVALGAAIGVVALRSELDAERTRMLLVTCTVLTLAGATLGQFSLPGPALILAAGLSALAFVYLVGQLVEITSLDLRLAGAGGMLPATIVGFVVGLALGR
jgi:hypothetical protein